MMINKDANGCYVKMRELICVMRISQALSDKAQDRKQKGICKTHISRDLRIKGQSLYVLEEDTGSDIANSN